MHSVKLKGPRVINGAVRYPAEGEIPVSDDEYQRLVDDKAIEEDEGDDFDAMTVAQLKERAEADGIDLGEATKKADIIAKIRAASVDAEA
jgi:hypothetical protein